jgi:hypothetical protein
VFALLLPVISWSTFRLFFDGNELFFLLVVLDVFVFG